MLCKWAKTEWENIYYNTGSLGPDMHLSSWVCDQGYHAHKYIATGYIRQLAISLYMCETNSNAVILQTNLQSATYLHTSKIKQSLSHRLSY